MKILITGTSCGIGKACAELFLQMNHEVIGFDIKDSSIQNKNYTHFHHLISYYLYQYHTLIYAFYLLVL